MSERTDRLGKLVVLQGKLKSLHETRRAGFVVAAARARADAEDLAAHFDAEGSLASAFPELYNRRISNALSLERANAIMAVNEAKAVAEAEVRGERIAKQWREARSAEERRAQEVESLELLGRNAASHRK